MRPRLSLQALAAAFSLVVACGQSAPDGPAPAPSATPAVAAPTGSSIAPAVPTATTPPSSLPPVPARPQVHVVLFTHIEDNTPPGPLDAPPARVSYMNLRARLIEMATAAKARDVAWSLQPDWKYLLAAQAFEDAATTMTTGGLSLFRYLRDTLGVHIDPHSHEAGGYNYTDVAHLLSTLGVGGSTVIGGHIWDPALPQFAEWDRFRSPVRGLKYPDSIWRGDILMGSGTPNHVNDPVVSGVWRPKDRDHYFEDDPQGNIACVGGFMRDLPGVVALADRYASGAVPATCLLTSVYHIRPADLLAPSGVSDIDATVLAPLEALRKEGKVKLTDFTSVVGAWRADFGGKSCLVKP